MRDTLSEIIEIDYHDLLEMAIQKSARAIACRRPAQLMLTASRS